MKHRLSQSYQPQILLWTAYAFQCPSKAKTL